MTALERRFDSSVPAVVLKLVPNVMHHGFLGVVRSLGRAGVPVYGVLEAARVPVASSRYLTEKVIWQPDPGDPGAVAAGLSRLADTIGRPAVLLPTDDVGALFLAEHGDGLRDRYLFTAPPAHLPRRVADKYSLYQLCREAGMASPESCLADSHGDAAGFAARVGYPLIGKVTSPWLTLGAIPSTSLVHNTDGLADLYHQCAHAGVRLMLQEFIPGGRRSDWFFHGYCDADSVCRPAFTGVKERSFPLGAGGTMYGRSAANEKLRDEVTALLTRLSYCGVMDLDIRLDARDDRYHLLDFNPRFGAQFRVFRDTAGMDVALAAYLDLTGQPIPSGDQVSERYFMAESYDPLAFLAYRRRGEITLRTWLSQVRAVDEFAWLARDDLRPFGLMCLRMAWKAATRAIMSGRRAA